MCMAWRSQKLHGCSSEGCRGVLIIVEAVKNRIANPGSMHETGCSGLVHSNDPEGWDGEGGGRGFRMGHTGTPVADSCPCMAKPIQYCKENKN